MNPKESTREEVRELEMSGKAYCLSFIYFFL